MTRSTTAVQQAIRTFPHLEISLQDDRPDRMITSRNIGNYLLTRFRSAATVVETVGRRSVAAGLGNHLKLVWQLGGRMRYEDANRALDVEPGDLIVTAMSGDYWMEMHEGHEALIIAFDPNDDPRWNTLALEAVGNRIAARAGISVSAGGVSALLSSGAGDRTEEVAARAMIDLALLSTNAVEAHEPALLARASMCIARNIADPAYGPENLARDVGMSRRSLYTHLASLGTSPGALIRRIRVDRARRDVLNNDGRSLLEIALANGFADGASLSHAFRRAFGNSPSSLRRQL